MTPASNTPSVFLSDPDVTLWHGDVLETLRELPAESVDCVVTSPPYWGLRDYGTPGQLGLEPTPEQYVERMVEVFREVRRVLCGHGTVYLNIGDSYASSAMQGMRAADREGPSPGTVQDVLSASSAQAVEDGEPRAREDVEGSVLPGEQGTLEPERYGTTTTHTGGDRGAPGREMPVLRGDDASLSDYRPRAERRGEGEEGNAASRLQEDPGRRVPTGSVPDPLLELQLGQGDSRVLPSFGDLKQKDLVGIPWMLAFALRADGWFLRSDIIWSKPNPMPESVTDRPTKAHEYVFLLSKQPRYFFDQEAVREAHIMKPQRRRVEHGENDRGRPDGATNNFVGYKRDALGVDGNPAGRNIRSVWRIEDDCWVEIPVNSTRAKSLHSGHPDAEGEGVQQAATAHAPPAPSVWEIPTQPYPEAHFATFPEELARRCIAAGTSEKGKCPECGAPWVRDIERGESHYARLKREQGHEWTDMDAAGLARGVITKEGEGGQTRTASGVVPSLRRAHTETVSWSPTCECWVPAPPDNKGAQPWSPRPSVVLDPFMGSGTVAYVARKLGRNAVGIDLSAEYLALAARRLQQQSLFAEATS